MADCIALVESAYEMGGDAQAWFDATFALAAPMLDRGQGVLAFAYAQSPTLPGLGLRATSGCSPALLESYSEATSAGASKQARPVLATAGTTYASLSEYLFRRFPEEAERFRQRTGFHDVVGFSAVTGTGYAISFAALADSPVATAPADRKRWACLAAHIGAGLRLRLALEGGDAAQRAPEAVLDPAARLHDATGPAQGSRAREHLRAAVRLRERARSRRGRADPDAALALWEGLVAGRWSLVDRFERDGKRFIVAHPNDPDVGDPRGLSRRERQVAEYSGMGRSQKEIAYLLGISTAGVSNAARRAAEKLGLAGRAELASFFAADGLRARLAEVALAGERLAVGSAPILDESALARLSETERSIAIDLLHGATVPEIARRRASSPLTVESQVKSIYAKLEVRSRVELATRVSWSRSH